MHAHPWHFLLASALLLGCPTPSGDKPSDGDADTDADTDDDTDGDTAAPNTAPSAPEVAISPASPSEASELTVTVVTESVDAEQDDVTYHYAWTVDGAPRADLAAETVPASETTDGQTWAVAVTPTDGTLEGAPGTSTVTIGNSPPSAPVVHIEPIAPNPRDELTLVFDTVAVDPNGDPLIQTLTWYEDGSLNAASQDSATVDARYVDGAEVWRVVVSVTDGMSDPLIVEASVTVSNTPPEITSVSLSPSAPHDDADLVVTATADDADGNDLEWSYVWFRDGVEATDVGNTDTVPAALTTIGETWICIATVSDGAAEDSMGSGSLTILDFEGSTTVSTFSAVLESDGAGGFPTATGSWAYAYLSHGGSVGENDCEMLWNVAAIENATLCPTCDFAFDGAFTLDASSVVTTSGPICTELPYDGTGTFNYTSIGSSAEVYDRLASGYHLSLYASGSGGFSYYTYGFEFSFYYAVTTAEDSAGDIHFDAYEYTSLHY